jgi:hypothetical protein
MADMVTTGRYVDIPCPSGKHQSSVVTFRNHLVAVLSCLSCEHGWVESGDHPSLRQIPQSTGAAVPLPSRSDAADMIVPV